MLTWDFRVSVRPVARAAEEDSVTRAIAARQPGALRQTGERAGAPALAVRQRGALAQHGVAVADPVRAAGGAHPQRVAVVQVAAARARGAAPVLLADIAAQLPRARVVVRRAADVAAGEVE